MSLFQHLNSLKLKHTHLEKSIELEQKRPLPDISTLHNLKREKLHLKEEIIRLSTQSSPSVQKESWVS